MKKVIALLLLLSLFCASCAPAVQESQISVDTDPTVTENSDHGTVYPAATVPQWTTGKADTTNSDGVTEHTTGEVYTEPPIVIIPTEDTFTAFMPMRDPNNHDYDAPVSLYPPKKLFKPDGWIDGLADILFFRVLSAVDDGKAYTDYKIQLVAVYGHDDSTLDTEKTMILFRGGLLTKQLFRSPPLENGKIYAAITAIPVNELNEMPILQWVNVLDVEEDNGTWYVLSRGMDFSDMACKIPITDPEENQIYKKGKHDKAIACMLNDGQPLPTYDYKCEIRAFLEEVRYRCIHRHP